MLKKVVFDLRYAVLGLIRILKGTMSGLEAYLRKGESMERYVDVRSNGKRCIRT